MKTCIIIGAAPCANFNYISSEIWEDAFVIAADGGYATAVSNNIAVSAFIGDLDSNNVMPDCRDVTILPCEKDYTDVHTAVNRALSDGYKKIYLLGCTNGRADHYFANVALLELIHNSGAQGVIIDGCNQIRFISEGLHDFARAAKYLSILPLDEKLCGVTLTGLKYPLTDSVIKREIPIAVSNEWVSDIATIEIKKGRALLIFSEDGKI